MKASGRLAIGALSRRTGTNIETIRYYERVGLLPAPARSSGGYRLYGRDHLKRLTSSGEPARWDSRSARSGRCFGCRTSASAHAPELASSPTRTSGTCEPRWPTFAEWSGC